MFEMARKQSCAVLLAFIVWTPPALAQQSGSEYWVYVGAESVDLLHRVRFGPDGATVEKTINVGELPNETEGPHGLMISRDGKHLYMTTGHGIPDGKLWKIDLGPDTVSGEPTFLGRFPATVDVTPDGLYAFVANFNLHGERVPSSVSVIYTPDMMEVVQLETCITPHGGRMSPDGSHLYSACIQSDEIVEIDTRTFDVSHRFNVAQGQEGSMTESRRKPGAPSCSPTWALPAPSGDRLYVACNKGDEILEISLADWTLLRHYTAGRGPYNLAITPDGATLVATLKQGAAVQFFDTQSGSSRGITQSSAKNTHGVVISPDGRYAFVTVESVGMDPGRLDIFDIATTELVASVPVGQQAGGIAFWKMRPAPKK